MRRQRHKHGVAYEALCAFLLETCEIILETQIRQHLDALNVTMEQLLEHGINVNVLLSSAKRDRDAINDKAGPKGMSNAHVTLGDLVIIQDGPLGAVEVSTSNTITTTPQTLNRLQSRWCIKGNEEYLEDSDGKFRFLRDKILKLRIWTLHELQLFHQLKDMVQKKMDVYASICQYKYELLNRDPQGPDLKAFDEECATITRQDHKLVLI